MERNRQVLTHRINMIGRAAKHFGWGRVVITMNKGGNIDELHLCKGDRINYRFASIEEAEDFVDERMVAAEQAMPKPLRVRRATAIMNRYAKESGMTHYDLPSLINEYEEKKMLQQRTNQQSEFPHGAEAVRHGRQGDTAAGIRTGKSHGTHVGSKAFGSVVATHGERHRAAALV